MVCDAMVRARDWAGGAVLGGLPDPVMGGGGVDGGAMVVVDGVVVR